MARIRLVVVFMFSVLVLQAQYPGYKPIGDPVRFKELFTTTAKSTQTIKSDFTQEKELSLLSEKIVSRGKFWFKKENKVRMEYQQPFQYLMVINQNNPRQVVVGIIGKLHLRHSRIPNANSELFQKKHWSRRTVSINPGF